MARKRKNSDFYDEAELKHEGDIGSSQEQIKVIETEETKKRCFKLADIIAASELPWSMAIQEAEQELSDLIKRIDPQTRNEVARRIRGYS